MILPDTYTVSAKTLPRARNIETRRNETKVLEFSDISFIGNTDISDFTHVLQLTFGSAHIRVQSDVDDAWRFKLTTDITRILSGAVEYTLYAIDPENTKEFYSLYKGTVSFTESDGYVEGRTIVI